MATSNAPPPLSLPILERIDAACDRFEQQWRAGENPRIEDYLNGTEAAVQPALLRALLDVELELRSYTASPPLITEYAARFPGDQALLREVFKSLARTCDSQHDAPGKRISNTVSLTSPAVDTSIPSPPRLPASAPPERLGRFEILEMLGEGAFGVVYKARDPQLDRIVAIKVPREGVLKTPEDHQRFSREARAAAHLNHPNICPVYEVGAFDGRDYIVMAYIEGKALSKIIKAGKVRPRHAAAAVRKLALALDEAHRSGIVHRDLKPANVMVNVRGEPIVMDFGLARWYQAGDAQLTRSGAIMGSPAYMSPEQARGDSPNLGPTSDIYSLAVILYELLTARRPFEGTVTEVLGKILHVAPDPPSRHRPNIDPRLESICLKAMAKDPQDRYQSMRELATALGDFLKERPADTVDVTPPAAHPQPDAGSTQNVAEMFANLSAGLQKQTEEIGQRHRRLTRVVAAGLAAMVLAVCAGIIFFARTPTVTVMIDVDVDLSDQSLSYQLDGKPVSADQLSKQIELDIGSHELVVYRGAEIVHRFHFNVSKDTGPRIEVREHQVTAKKTTSEPTPAIVPHGAYQATQHQADWAKKLGVPVEFTNQFGMKFRLIPPGTYRRGLSQADVDLLISLDPTIKPGDLNRSRPQHTVELTKPFWMGEHEVTVGQFRQFASATGFVTRAETLRATTPSQRTWKSVPWEQTDSHPVVNISWNEAQAFAEWLSQQSGWDYRLPSDAEWEFACRAGTESPWWTGNELPGLVHVANVADATAKLRWKTRNAGITFIPHIDGHAEAAPTGSYPANPFGLRDMIGNVWEWCADWNEGSRYPDFPGGLAVDPQGPQEGAFRMRRGGSWLHGLWCSHAAARMQDRPDTTIGTAYGFRIAISFDPKQTRDLITDRVVASWILEAGGRVRTTEGQELQGKPDQLPEFPFRVMEVFLGGGDKPPRTEIHDADLQQFESLAELKIIDLGSTGVKVRGSGVAHLARLPKLEVLHFYYCPLTNEALPHIGLMTRLSSLRLDATSINDEGLVHMTGLTELRKLNLAYTRVGDGLKHLKRLSKLEELQLHGTDVSDDDLVHLAPLTALKLLYLGGHQPKGLTGAGLSHLWPLKSLEVLGLSNTGITNDGLQGLTEMENLVWLDISQTKVTDAGLKHLYRLQKLRTLNLAKTAVTSDGVRALQNALPQCKVNR
jgi:formylglycine-generating enzyme required for sulfatase activity/serine/threonine protein kinase